ncbi:MAG TPA: hypothetical protein VME20_01110 [Acidimicrobiales bacterium]|nr:hypothetical protein [Acidimicrobiales bacterium]
MVAAFGGGLRCDLRKAADRWHRDKRNSRGVRSFYERGTGHLDEGPFALDLSRDPELAALYLDAEGEDAYLRDRSCRWSSALT